MMKMLAGRAVAALVTITFLGAGGAIADQAGLLGPVTERVGRFLDELRTPNTEPADEPAVQLPAGDGARIDAPDVRVPELPEQARPAGLLARATNAVATAAAAVWRMLRGALAVLFVIAAVSAAARLRARRRRAGEVRRYELVLSREDQATPYQREKLFDAWHGQLVARWWERPLAGQQSVALEIHDLPTGRQALALAATEHAARALEGRLQATYPDVRLEQVDGQPAWSGHVIRLKKRKLFTQRIQTVKDDAHVLTESIVATMSALREPVTVQLVLTPAPWLVHRLSRALLKLHERRLTGDERHDPSDIGVDSVVEDKELKGSLETQHRSLYWTEIRVCSDSYETATAICGLFSESRSENQLVEREMRLRRGLYAKRIAAAGGNPLPAWWRGVLSSSELAALWSLPRQRVKGAQLERSAVRRAPAPPTIARDPRLAIMRDERGPVGLLREDRQLGIGLVGGQNAGKTSTMAAVVDIDVNDIDPRTGEPDCAVILVDPKQDLARLALELVPEHRTCWYMDFGRPEIGINPLKTAAEPGVVADVILQAFKEAYPDAVKDRSDRFLRHAAMAVCAVEEEPSFWHMHELLEPRRREYRDRVVARLQQRGGMAALAMYWATTLPDMWEDATRGQMSMALDAPRNKLERLITTEEVDKLLRHPVSIDLWDVIRRREVLIVNGAMGEVGEDNAIVVMQMMLQLVNLAMMRQQRLPREERVRVCLHIDEAHLLLTPTLARMLALHRAAGPLEVTAAWQYSEQIQDKVIRSGLKSLLRNRVMFAMGEVDDAREQAEIAMEVYSDLIRSDQEDRERLRFTPDDIVRLPRHHAICSWNVRGQREQSFIGQTYAMEGRGDPSRPEHHLERQRQRGGRWPEDLSPPAEIAAVPDYASELLDDAATEPPSAIELHAPPAPVENPEPEQEATPAPAEASRNARRSAQEDRERPHEPQDDARATYRAVHREINGLIWDAKRPDAVAEVKADRRTLEILAALWQHKVFLAGQLASEWWPDNDPSAAQRQLNKLYAAGLVNRCRFSVPRGKHEYAYLLARPGLELAKRHLGEHGRYIPEDAKFREEHVTEHGYLLGPLQMNAWALCFRRLVGDHATGWTGDDHGAIEVPTKIDGRRNQPIGPGDVSLGGYAQVRDVGAGPFARVRPDATIEMAVRERQFALMFEFDRTQKPGRNADKFRRYDALTTCWWRAVPALHELGEPPVAVFICVDEASVFSFMDRADQDVTGALIERPGDPQGKWRYPGRERMLFVTERDIHEGTMRAFMLPPKPREVTRRRELAPRQVELPGRVRERAGVQPGPLEKPW